MSRSFRLAAIGGMCALASGCTQPQTTAATTPAVAAPPSTPVAYSSTAHGTTPGCPGIRYFVHRDTANQLVGYFFYTDASGVAQGTGSVDPATGKFQMTVTNLDGNGPAGTVSGVQQPDGAFHGELKGSGCANVTIQTGPTPTTMGPSAS